jgi:uncharacterized protein (DUF2336 family)
VSGSDFRQITLNGEAPKRERLFRAAVSAFCSLTRPSRRDISQLEDLTLPLFDCVSPESRRYVAAALSECPYPPPRLVRRLCDEPLEIAAPLLIRSKALTEIDLLAFIGRHGAGHARAIGRRPGLNATIADLIAVIDRKSRQPHAAPAETATRKDENGRPAAEPPSQGAESARRRLRSLMTASDNRKATTGGAVPSRYARLRDTALADHPAFFHTALADALQVDYAAVRRVARTSSCGWLLTALRALDLNDERAFLIAACVVPSEFSGAESIRLFLSRYRLLSREAALRRVVAWQVETEAGKGDTEMVREAVAPDAAGEGPFSAKASG